ncbi:hypothetical protein [Tepidibacter aestuarii]|uniref:hypothetical protein n=1 Tax=Tepidibacter aestuarii TaxID=2925782 RepID=UPI0020C173C7|nr:hypothetical protein [Tepidibacter aestuarii]
MNVSPIYQILSMILLIYIIYFFITKIIKLPTRVYNYLDNMDKIENDVDYSRKK